MSATATLVRRAANVGLRTDQVGSLIRPQELIDARRRCAAGEISKATLTEVEDRAVLEAVAAQEATGIGVVTDGEMRRQAWQTDLSDAVEGFADEYPVEEVELADGTIQRMQLHAKVVEGRLRQHRPIVTSAARFLSEHTTSPFKVTLPSPVRAAHQGFRPGVTDGAYADRAELLADLIDIYADEMRDLATTGAAYLQLDEGFIGYVSDAWREELAASGIDPEDELARDIAAENAVWAKLDGVDVVRGAHLCRGSQTRSGGTGTYDWLGERLFDRLDVDRFLLEYDTERAGGFEPLRFLPKGKVAVLGLITSKFPQLETEDDLLRRIEQATKFTSIEQLALSPQCGFAGVADVAHMTHEAQWRKLELVVSVAEKAWA